MRLTSHIISNVEAELCKYRTSFAHPLHFHSILKQGNTQNWLEQLATMLISFEYKEHSEFILFFNISLQSSFITNLFCSSSEWICQMTEYSLRTGEQKYSQQFNCINTLQSFFQNWKPSTSTLYTFKINLLDVLNQKYLIFFPESHQNETSSQLDHQIMKISNYLKTYISLQTYPEENMIFETHLSRQINSFLYENQVESISFVLCPNHFFSLDKILQQISQLKTPEHWREKKSYRAIKKDIFLLKCKENQYVQHLRSIRFKVTQTVNSLTTLAGFNPLAYSNISIDSLKLLKAQGFSQKVSRITEYDQNLEVMQSRLFSLKEKKGQLKKLKQKIQQEQVNQLLSVKNQIVSLQTKGPTCPDTKFFFKRQKPHKQLMTTIFLRAQKKTDSCSNSFLLNTTNRKTKRKSSVKFREEKDKRSQFKSIDKKVAAVVKDGISCSTQLDFSKLREQLQMEQLNIEFEIQKSFQKRKNEYSNAIIILQKLMQGFDCLHFF